MESADMVALREYNIQEMYETMEKHKINPCDYDPEHIEGVRGAVKYLDIRCRSHSLVEKIKEKYPTYNDMTRAETDYIYSVFKDKYYTHDYNKLEKIKNARHED